MAPAPVAPAPVAPAPVAPAPVESKSKLAMTLTIGYDQKQNRAHQDRLLICENVKFEQRYPGDEWSLMCVFDGHGDLGKNIERSAEIGFGSAQKPTKQPVDRSIAQFAAQNLLRILTNKMGYLQVKEALIATFLQIDSDYLSQSIDKYIIMFIDLHAD